MFRPLMLAIFRVAAKTCKGKGKQHLYMPGVSQRVPGS